MKDQNKITAEEMRELYGTCTDFRSFLEIRAKTRPDVPLFQIFGRHSETPEREISSEDFRREVDALGTWFFCNGYRNRHIAILGENSYEWVLTFIAAAEGNNTALLLDTTKTVEELSDIASFCDAELLVYSASYAKTAMDIKKNTAIALISMDSLAEKIEEGKRLLEDGSRDFADHKTDAETMSVICCTSGTTGRSKGVMLCQRNIVRNVCSTIHGIYTPDFGRGFLILPLYHIYSVVHNLLMSIAMGGTLIITAGIRTFVQDYIRLQPELLFLVPRLFEILDATVEKSRDENGRIPFRISKYGFAGGAMLDVDLLTRFAELGMTVTGGYGMTETAGADCLNTDFSKWPDGSMKFNPGVGYRILDPDENGVGELCLSGENIMLGYYKMPEETEKALPGDGYLHTGDLAMLTAEDRVIIKGRKDRMMILPNGVNVSPDEIEADLKRIDAVSEVMVFMAGETITAEIYAEDAGRQEEILEEINRVNRMHSSYRTVEKVKFRTVPFERTASGKIKLDAKPG